MKRKNSFLFLTTVVMMMAGLAMSSCSTGDDGYDDAGVKGAYAPDGYSLSATSDGGGTDGDGKHDGQIPAGIVTAGEWNDLNHWVFWSKLMNGQEYAEKSNYWECYTNLRVAVEVTDPSGKAQAGVKVQLLRVASGKQTVLWQAVTDNTGRADCWLSPWQKSSDVDASSLRVSINGSLMDEAPVVSGWNEQEEPTVNAYHLAAPATAGKAQADIAFIVDATGSMSDEIRFLQSDLLDIIGKVSALRPEQTLRTAALFYRDEGDDYLTCHSDFSADARTTADFVGKQQAGGGGDYPEAVHTAMEHMLQKLSWSSDATTQLAFLILDAPAHHQDDVIKSLQQSVTTCARQGIRLIPVAASGVDKNTEFMLRFYAILTGGTYVFLTNDSGVGNPHIEATVGDYKVELLNELLIRLIDQYLVK